MRSKATLVLLLLLAISSFSFKSCGGSDVSDPYRNAAKAADDIAASLNTMTKIKRQLGTSGKLPADRERALTDLLLKGVAADRAFINQIKILKADPNAADKAKLCTLFQAVTTAMTDLKNSGLDPIPDADSKSKLSVVFETITRASGIIASVGLCS
jgi:hypothetical protein